MFQITVTDNFSSAHSLRGYPGKCANTHGHNFDVKLTLNAHNLDELGMIIDFAIVKEKLRDALQILERVGSKCKVKRVQNHLESPGTDLLNGAGGRDR